MNVQKPSTKIDPALRVPTKNRKRFRRDQESDIQSILNLDWIHLHKRHNLSVGRWEAFTKKRGWRKEFAAANQTHFLHYELPRTRLEDFPPMVREQSIEMARIIYGDLILSGCLRDFPGLEMIWVEVIGSIAMQPPQMFCPTNNQVIEFGGFDSAWRYLLTGLSSVQTRSFSGWRAKLGQDPTYALRETFLVSMRRGWGIRRPYRWESHRHWQPRGF